MEQTLMIMASDNFYIPRETELTLVTRVGCVSLVLVACLKFFVVSRTVTLRLELHFAVIKHERLNICQVFYRIKFLERDRP